MRENTHNESDWEGMALVYSLIAKGMVVLAEYQTPGYENVKAFADEITNNAEQYWTKVHTD